MSQTAGHFQSLDARSGRRPTQHAPRRLKPHAVWLRPTTQAHADLKALMGAIAASKPGFVDAPALPAMAPMASVILSDDDGNLFALDNSGPGPVMRPWSQREAESPAADGGRHNSHGGASHAEPQPAGRAQTPARSDPTGAATASSTTPAGAAPPAPSPSGGPPGTPSFAEQVLAAAGQELGEQFLKSLFSGQSIGPALGELLDKGNILSSLGGAALQNLGNMLMGSLMGALFGGVTDESSIGSQLAAKFGPQLMGMAQQNIGKVLDAVQSGGLSPEVMDQIEAYFFGVASAASIPLGKAVDAGAGGYVLVEGGPHALKQGDLALHDNCNKPPGAFVEGHPTIFINGKQAIGKGHKAICGCGETVMPKILAGTVLMGKPPPPPAPSPANGAGGGSGGGESGGGGSGSGGATGTAGTIGDACDPNSQVVKEALAENEEGPEGIGRPLVCEADPANPSAGTVQRPPSWDPPDWAKTLFGIENVATEAEAAQGIENWELLWGAIEIGGPQEPRAGAADSWWIPDKVFGYDMADFYLYHDQHFDDDRNLSQLDTIFGVEAASFYQGLRRGFDPGRLVLQMLYSTFTTSVAVGTAAANSLRRRPSAKDRGRP